MSENSAHDAVSDDRLARRPPAVAIKVRGVSKRFGGAAALDQCTLDILDGAVTGLIGPNGAGKTTLLNVICGQTKPDGGRVFFREADITGLSVPTIAARGIVRTFQLVRDLAGLTVLETLLLAPGKQIGETLSGALFRRRASAAQERANARKARDLLARVGLWSFADVAATSLSGGQRKLLELARALMLDPAVVLLDEPAAGVAPPLVTEIVRLVRELKGEGITFAVVEHDMQLVRDLCDQVHVLAEGQRLVSGSFAQIIDDRRVVDAYLGGVA